MKHRLAAGALLVALAGATGVSAAPQQVGGAAGLVAAVVQIATDDVVTVNVVDSFNNINVLNNVLNNSPILSNNDIEVTIGNITILENFLNNNNVTLENFLNNNDITVQDILQIVVLDTGDIIVFV